MIEIPRLLVRQFRTLLRRSLPARSVRPPHLWIALKAGKDHLTVQAQHADVDLAYRATTNPVREVIVLPAQALDDMEGRSGSVTLERQSEKVVARWTEQNIPRIVEYDTADPSSLPAFPTMPNSFATNPPGLLKALDDAMHSAANESVRFSTPKIQLRGSGQIVATDSRQLLIQSGFTFPWKDNVLIPRLSLFGAGVLLDIAPVKIGRTDKHVFVQVGDWTIALSADTEGRFPNAEEAVPRVGRTTWSLSSGDADMLVRVLQRVPGEKDENAPITIDLNGKAILRARATGQTRPVELTLKQSSVTGPPVRLCANRHLLLRALQLGFREVRLVDADTPVVAQDHDRKYVFMPLSKDSALPPSADAIAIVPHVEKASPSTPPSMNRRNVIPMPTNHAPPPSEPLKPPLNGDAPALVPEVEALQSLLRDALARVSRLVGAVKQQRRQTKLFHSALSSLRQLQQPPA